MRLPYSSEINIFNYVLKVISNLSIPPKGCSGKVVNDACKNRTYNAQIIDYRRILILIGNCGLITIDKRYVKLTKNGITFLELNPEGILELSSEQKKFIANSSIFNGRYRSQAVNVFGSFFPDHDEVTYKYEYSDLEDVNLKNKAAFHLFNYLGVISKVDRGYIVNPEYVSFVKEIRAEKKGLTQAELELRLDENRKLGFMAEELVVEYEQIRLKSLGLVAEADRVKRISELEPDAGYDINSFSGEGPMGEYDRFIEVKSSQKPFIGFYWTINEINKAKKDGSLYWIYFLANLKQTDSAYDIKPLMVQNPYIRIFENSSFACEPRVYKVSVVKNLEFKQLDGDIKGDLLE